MVTHNPLHGSGRAEFPHPALASGSDAKPSQRIGVTDTSRRQKATNKTPHPVPENPAHLASSRQRAMPEAAHLESEQVERRALFVGTP